MNKEEVKFKIKEIINNNIGCREFDWECDINENEVYEELEKLYYKEDFLDGFIRQFNEELSDKDWTVSEWLKWLKLNNFKIVKNDI